MTDKEKAALAEKTCRRCRRRAWWISIYGVAICEACHTPPTESVVAERVPVDPAERSVRHPKDSGTFHSF